MARAYVAFIAFLVLIVVLFQLAINEVQAKKQPPVINRVEPRNHGMESMCFEGVYVFINNHGHMFQPVGHKGSGIFCEDRP